MQRNVLKGFLTHHAKVRAIAVAIILLFDARGTLARAAEAEKLNVFYSSIAASSVVTWIPKEAGIYKKYGLDVNLIYAVGSQAVTTLMSGDTQIGQGSGAAAVLSRLSGSDVTIGLDPSLDIKMIQTGGVPEILQYMQQGVVKGGVISSPMSKRFIRVRVSRHKS